MKEKTSFKTMVWMFFLCSMIGLCCEGLYILFQDGHWESHVVTMFIPMCPIYGLGAVLFYLIDHALPKLNIILKAMVIGVAATVMEFLCGLLLYCGYGMRAWDYTNDKFNIMGLICLEFLFYWMLFAFGYLLVVRAFRWVVDKKELKKPKFFSTVFFKVVTIVFAVFMVVDIISAFVNIKFWSERYYGNPVDTKVEQFVETNWNDEYMQNRFIEWKFLK